MHRLTCFGALTLDSGGREWPTFAAHRKRLALLAVLAAAGSKGVSRERLLLLFWPDSDSEHARNALKQLVFAIRSELGAVLQGPQNADLRLDSTVLASDVAEFRAAVARGDPESAVALYGGPFLDGFYLRELPEFERWAEEERARLADAYADALETLARTAALTDPRAAVPWRKRLVTARPLDGRVAREYLAALVAAGDRSAALQFASSHVALLRSELGTAPDDAFVAMFEQLRRESRAAVSGVSATHLPGSRTSLPPSVRLVGREQAISDLLALVHQRPVVTLFGPGGVGKSALAMALASDERLLLRQGAHLVDLSGLESASHLAATIAETIGLGVLGGGDPERQLFDVLRDQSMLLALDNFEHLVAASDFVARLAAAAPALRIVVTTRERLHIAVETVFDVRPLGVDVGDGIASSEAPAVRLFLETAKRVVQNFEPTADDLASIVRICRLVDGMPLGIVIATPLIRALSCTELAEELERGVHTITTPLRDLPARHRSLAAAFEQSWARLNEQERGLLARLSVFRGGFTRDSAERVAGATVDTLLALIDKSLVYRRAAGRYQLHEIVRVCAAEKAFASRDALQRNHAAYFGEYVDARRVAVQGRQQRMALDEIAQEIDNIRAGWLWAVERQDEELLGRYADSLDEFYRARGWFREGTVLWQECEQLKPSPLAIKLLARYARFLVLTGEIRQAHRVYRQTMSKLKALPSEPGRHYVLRGLATIAWQRGKYRASLRLLDRAIKICHSADDPLELAGTVNDYAISKMSLGDYQEAERRFREVIDVFERFDKPISRAVALMNLDACLEAQGRRDEGRALVETARVLAKEGGNVFVDAVATLNLGISWLRSGRSDKARPLLESAEVALRRIGVAGAVAKAAIHLGEVAVIRGDHDAASARYHEGLTTAVRLNWPPLMAEALCGVASLYHRAGQTRRALDLLMVALQEPTFQGPDRQLAQELLDKLVAAESARGSPVPQSVQYGELRAVVADVLNELAAGLEQVTTRSGQALASAATSA